MMKYKFLSILLAVFVLVPNLAFAICEGPIVPCGHSGLPQCGLCHVFALLNNLFKFFFTCILPIAGSGFMIWGGFYFLMAGTSPAELQKAKGIITGVVIGIAIIFIAWVFLNTFLTSIGVSTWTGLENWWTVQCD